MRLKYSMKLRTIVETHNLGVIYKASDFDEVEVWNYNISRPSLQFVGFYDYFDKERIQITGKAEAAYLRTLDEKKREEVIDALFAQKIPALVVCHRVVPDAMMVDAARRHDVTLLTTDLETSEFVAQVLNTLRTHLADRRTEHGVLVQVHGEGLLIQGESGIGKSEVALELVKRGHRLVADDAVELRRMGRTRLMGSAPKMIRYLMELRGLGIIDVRRIYGVGAVLPVCDVDLVVKFVRWEEGADYDRLGLNEETANFLGVNVPQVTIPVAPARNLAIILEVAAMNHREKKLGHNTAKDLMERHDQGIDNGWDGWD
ncbi:MAG: HPr(Ser) kinase/phosphatase [Ruminococcaceae bacterium]|nr:HPr(Ser) kinase/phosphatase [Oscillospiraceae bacterium]